MLISTRLVLLILLLPATWTSTANAVAAAALQQQPYDCPKECICLSSTQVRHPTLLFFSFSPPSFCILSASGTFSLLSVLFGFRLGIFSGFPSFFFPCKKKRNQNFLTRIGRNRNKRSRVGYPGIIVEKAVAFVCALDRSCERSSE